MAQPFSHCDIRRRKVQRAQKQAESPGACLLQDRSARSAQVCSAAVSATVQGWKRMPFRHGDKDWIAIGRLSYGDTADLD